MRKTYRRALAAQRLWHREQERARRDPTPARRMRAARAKALWQQEHDRAWGVACPRCSGIGEIAIGLDATGRLTYYDCGLCHTSGIVPLRTAEDFENGLI